ncbi:hypothetical protein [Mesorhizobium sp.]|uniref:hypothetical protein n=1 Tax=Mesorhizobium sp. TaxID=1871066 RepID=UPI0025F29F0F|nr:hypothetical protein [Mesorhizobium sp.]
MFFACFDLGVERIGILKAIYPATWCILQIATSPLSDRWGRKPPDRRRHVGAGRRPLFLTAAAR